MRIGITINEVFRDFVGQLAYIYDKYEKPFSIEKTPITDFEKLHEIIGFKTKDEMNEFLYSDHAFEVFSAGDQVYDNIANDFNYFLSEINDEEEHEIVIISREASRSIPATLFFLAKIGVQADNIKFVTKYENKWDYVDVLITANPRTLACKPENKKSIKVLTTYNANCEADFTINKLSDFTRSEELQNKILNN